MKGRVWIAQALAVLLAFIPMATPAAAQANSLQAALAGLERAADLLAAGLDNPAIAAAQAEQALQASLRVRAQLEAVLAARPADDFVRSRTEAVLDQTNEAITDLQEGLAQRDLLSAKLGEARAQILEASAELRPALAAAPPERLPSAGGLPVLSGLLALAAAALASGLATRRLHRAR